MFSEWILVGLLFLGLLSGLLGGLLGIGGGVVTVPALYFLFQYFGLFGERDMEIAVSTSLAAGFVTSAVSAFAQFRKKAILFSVLKFLLGGLILGCICGSFIGHHLSSALFTSIFGVMAVLLGAYFCFPRLPNLSISPSPNGTLSLFGFLMGSISSLLGIGGGSMTFPILLGYHVPAKNASATSSVSTLITTFFGSMTYLFIAWGKPEFPDTFGSIDVPSWIAISAGSILSSPFGVKLSSTLPVAHIKQIFGVCLCVIGLSMIVL